MTRYQKLIRGGIVVASGSTLTSVCCMGEGVIVDYKARRIAYHPFYPPSVTTWRVAGELYDTWAQLQDEVSRYISRA